MKRYIKVNGEWIDTLGNQEQFDEIYCIYKNKVYMYHSYDVLEKPALLVGVLEDERE